MPGLFTLPPLLANYEGDIIRAESPPLFDILGKCSISTVFIGEIYLLLTLFCGSEGSPNLFYSILSKSLLVRSGILKFFLNFRPSVWGLLKNPIELAVFYIIFSDLAVIGFIISGIVSTGSGGGFVSCAYVLNASVFIYYLSYGEPISSSILYLKKLVLRTILGAV